MSAGEMLLASVALFGVVGLPALTACYVALSGRQVQPADADADQAHRLRVFTAEEMEALDVMERELADMQRAQDADVLRQANRAITRRRALSAPRPLPAMDPARLHYPPTTTQKGTPAP